MDPFSTTVGVLGVLDSVTNLSCAISRFKHDYKLADEDLDLARQHALLLKEEIRALASREKAFHSSSRKAAMEQHNSNEAPESHHLAREETSFTKAISTAHELLSTIEASFPLRSEPHTWRSRARWAMKDKNILAQLKERLRFTESTLQGIVGLEELRVSHMIYRILLKQQSTLDKLERGETSANPKMVVNNQNSSQPMHPAIQAQFSSVNPITKQSTQARAKPNKPSPWRIQFKQGGFSTQVVALANDGATCYRSSTHITLLGKMYSVRLQFSYPDFSFDRMLHVRNIVPTDSAIAVACKTGDFDSAQRLLTSGLAHGSDITPGGRPMLDYAIESGSARLVCLLLDNGAHLDMTYGEHNMTALQSSFLRGNLDIARILVNKEADIEYIDSDGYSVLSYLWVVVKPLEKSGDFMSLCLANDFSEVNACDSRGWFAFHRAAAIGTPEDVEAFLHLGGSLDLRAKWYGWTALFFAASHDNVETLQAIIRHSGPDVYESLDGDGWNLLHCSVYFGASRVTKFLLQNGIEINQLTHPAPLREDPELYYRELTPCDIAIYMGPNRYRMFMEALAETGREEDLKHTPDIYWDATLDTQCEDSEEGRPRPIYGVEDVVDRWKLLHWASYNGSPKAKSLFLLKGVDSEHLDAITLEEHPTLLPTSPFERR